MEDADPDEVRKWLHVMSQMSAVYVRLVVDANLEQRLQELEVLVAKNGHFSSLELAHQKDGINLSKPKWLH